MEGLFCNLARMGWLIARDDEWQNGVRRRPKTIEGFHLFSLMEVGEIKIDAMILYR